MNYPLKQSGLCRYWISETVLTATGYRTYDETAVKRLIFVRRFREGLPMTIQKTLKHYTDEKRSSAEVKPRDCAETGG